jgi:serine/threonine-protein kinase
MELLNGDSLRALLNASGRFSVQRAVNLVLQASAGIAAAHSVGVIHRDLKPENLMVTQILYVGEHLKVLDFGVARLNGSGTTTTTGAVMGTPHYMSPEQAKGDAEIDERTDVYALGAVLYELISGTKAHPGEAYNKIIYHVLSANVPPLGEVCPEVPRRLSDIVDKCLAKDPSERFASMKALARALQTFAVNEQGEIDLTSVDLGDATLAYSSPQSASRRRWAWFGLIGAVCFGGGYAAARTQPPRVEGHADTHRQIASSSESVREHQPLSASAAQHADDAPPSTPQVDARPTPATLPRSPADDTSQRQLKSHPMRQFPRRVHRPEV